MRSGTLFFSTSTDSVTTSKKQTKKLIQKMLKTNNTILTYTKYQKNLFKTSEDFLWFHLITSYNANVGSYTAPEKKT